MSIQEKNLQHFLETHQEPRFIVTFTDGEQYAASSLDLWGENDEGEYEVMVEFSQCLFPSKRAKCASAGVTGIVYELNDIERLYDEHEGYALFERTEKKETGEQRRNEQKN